MAHSCPVCACKCTCRGDIDDIVLPDEKREATCTCCLVADDYYDDFDAIADIEDEYFQEARNAR